MSDSLRDQLLKAGFAEPAPKAKPARKHKPKARGKPTKQPVAQSQSGGAKNAATSQASASTAGNQPKAGYTHVTPPVAKKKKKQKAPAIKRRAGSWSTHADAATSKRSGSSDTSPEAKQRQQMKGEIQTLIDSTALKQYTGEEVYRFTLQNKIREILVSESVRKQLVAGELAITRLNGATRVIPASTATDIRAINPNWLIFISTDVSGGSDEDEEFPIPDDLVW